MISLGNAFHWLPFFRFRSPASCVSGHLQTSPALALAAPAETAFRLRGWDPPQDPTSRAMRTGGSRGKCGKWGADKDNEIRKTAWAQNKHSKLLDLHCKTELIPHVNTVGSSCPTSMPSTKSTSQTRLKTSSENVDKNMCHLWIQNTLYNCYLCISIYHPLILTPKLPKWVSHGGTCASVCVRVCVIICTIYRYVTISCIYTYIYIYQTMLNSNIYIYIGCYYHTCVYCSVLCQIRWLSIILHYVILL